MPANESILGQQVVYNDADESLTHAAGGNPHGGGGGGGGTTLTPYVTPPTGGLQFNLIWDSSVTNAPTGFVADVEATANYLASLYSAHEVVNVHVGWGEINGQGLSGGALGESETNGVLESYTALDSATQLGNNLQLASNEPINAQFFISTAQAKAFGVLPGNSTAIDGYVGFGTLGHGTSWNMTNSLTDAGTTTASTQYDLQGVVQHELSEVMGRIGMEGESFNGKPTYSALDLFDYKSPGVLELSGGGGYYSADNGQTDLGNFNAVHGGDIADWASYTSPFVSGTDPVNGDQDAFDAYTWNGIATDLSHSDVLLMDSLGYSLG